MRRSTARSLKFSPYLLLTLEFLDWIYGATVKIFSALDDGIFADDLEFPWQELYQN